MVKGPDAAPEVPPYFSTPRGLASLCKTTADQTRSRGQASSCYPINANQQGPNYLASSGDRVHPILEELRVCGEKAQLLHDKRAQGNGYRRGTSVPPGKCRQGERYRKEKRMIVVDSFGGAAKLVRQCTLFCISTSMYQCINASMHESDKHRASDVYRRREQIAETKSHTQRRGGNQARMSRHTSCAYGSEAVRSS